MTRTKKTVAVLLAVLCVLSAFSVNVFAATKYASYGGKYGKMIPVKADGKTQCESYSVKGTKGDFNFFFDSKGYKSNVYFGFTIYSDKERQDILVEKYGVFPATDSIGTLSVDFSKLESQTYYGITYTYKKSGNDLVIDKDSIYLFDIKLNKIGNSTVKITEAESLYNGNYIEWSAVKYADFYRVYRRTSTTGKWSKLADTKELNYFDKTARNGQKYYYTVRAFDNSASSKYNTKGVGLAYLGVPQINSSERLADNAVKITWSKVEGAENYRIYRREANESKYTALATIDAKETEYTDTSAKENGNVFYYKVRALNGTVSSAVSNASKTVIFGTFKPSASFNGNVVKLKWDVIDGASSYTLFRKEDNGEWQILKTFEATSNFTAQYTDSDVSVGKNYSYSLIVLRKGEYSSFDSNGTKIYCLNEPKITTLKASVDNSVQLKWQAVSGATSYNIYRKSATGKYELLGSSKTNGFYDTADKTNNLYYTYYIKAIGKNSVSLSGNETSSLLFMKAPENISVSNGTVKWNRVPGATSYVIYRKVPNGSYAEIGSVSSSTLKFTDKTAKKDGKYYYTVAAMNGKIKGAYSIGKGVNCLDCAEITKIATAKNGGATISWSKVSGADGYYVYRKTANGSWKKLTKTSSLSYTDTSSRVNGTEYFYTVKAYNSKGNGIYDNFGTKHIYISTPKVTTQRQKDGTVTLKWNEIKNVDCYRVYRKTESGSWKCLDSKVKTVSYTDKTAKKGTVYYYKVYAQKDGFLSGYNQYKVK